MSTSDKENSSQVQHIFSNTNENLVQDLSQQTSGLLQLFTEQTVATNPISTTSLTPNQRRTLLFNVQQPFEVPIEEFDAKWWPLVTNVWMKFNYRNHVNGNSWKTFLCRFNKPFKSSTRKEDVPSEKR